MKFNSWQTMFDEAGKINPEEKKLPLDKRRQIEHGRITDSAINRRVGETRTSRLLVEYNWALTGKPYYNIHPKIFSKLIHTNLDKIPCEFIEIPKSDAREVNNFPPNGNIYVDAICLRFSEDIPLQYKDMGQNRMQKFDYDPDKQSGSRCALVSRVKRVNPDKEDENCVDFLVFLDEGFRQDFEGKSCLVCNSFHLRGQNDLTIPSVLQNSIDEETSPLHKEMLKQNFSKVENIFRVAVTVGFLADTPDDGLLVPDILNRDKSKYERAVAKHDTESMDAIVKRSQRRGKNGWNVGTNEMFVEEHDPKGSSSSGNGRELQYSHIRSGHPHAVRYGEGKNKVKIKWFRSTQVRADLPFKEE